MDHFEKGLKRGKISEISHILKIYRICKDIRIDQFASRIRFRWCEFVNSYFIRIKLSCGHIIAKTSYPSKCLDGICWNLAKSINIIMCKLSLSCWNVSIEIGNSSLVTLNPENKLKVYQHFSLEALHNFVVCNLWRYRTFLVTSY